MHTQQSSAEILREKEQLFRSNVEMEQRLQQLDFVRSVLLLLLFVDVVC